VSGRTVALAAAVGVLCGFVGGFLGGAVAVRDPGRGRGAEGTLRGDLDRVERSDLVGRTSSLQALEALSTRVAEIEKGLAAAPTGTVRRVGFGQARPFLETRVDLLAALAALAPPPGGDTAPPTEEEAGEWVTLARGDPDPGRRFSALSMLGRSRTDRSVHASIEALQDPSELVVWQALRNLGRFQERAAARDVVPNLKHASVAVRAAAYEALRRMGAPDVSFDAADLEEHRRGPAETLERWVEQLP